MGIDALRREPSQIPHAANDLVPRVHKMRKQPLADIPVRTRQQHPHGLPPQTQLSAPFPHRLQLLPRSLPTLHHRPLRSRAYALSPTGEGHRPNAGQVVSVLPRRQRSVAA